MNNELRTINDILIFLIESKFSRKVEQYGTPEITSIWVGNSHIVINIKTYPIIVVIINHDNNHIRYLNSIDDIERVYNDIIQVIDI